MKPTVGAKVSQLLQASAVLLTILLVTWAQAVGHGVLAGRR